MGKLRIAHICLSGQYIDGWGYQENLLPRYLQEEGAENIVVCSRNSFPANVPQDVVDAIKAKGPDYFYEDVRVVRIKTRCVTSSLSFAGELYKTLESLHPDVVFHHDVIFSTLIPSARYSRKHNATLFVDNHADELNFTSNRLWRIVFHKVLNRLACRTAGKQVKKFYGVSPMRCDFLKKYYGIKDSRIELLPIGADVKEADRLVSKLDLRKKYGFDENDTIVISGGKMGIDKGTDALIKAIEGTGKKLILFGLFTDVQTRELAEKSSATTVFGWCDRQRTLELLKLSDLACWPVHHTTLYEDAVSVGTPLLVRKSGNSQHLVAGNGGWTTKETLTEDIDRFFAQDQAEVARAAKAVRDRISYMTIAQKILEDQKKRRILFIMHMPPPVHGAAMVGQFIHDSALINSEFDAEFINLATAKSLEDIGSLRLSKLSGFVSLYRRTVASVKSRRPDLVYITPNAKGVSFFKEYLIVKKIKRTGVKVIAHYHNKGVSTMQDSRRYDRLYRKFFKDMKVILLSGSLYPDIEKYVTRENVFICPNGIPRGAVSGAREEAGATRLLFLSNLLPAKGPLVLLDALKDLKDRGYGFTCDVVGGETKQMDGASFLAEIERRGLAAEVAYQGKKYGEEKEAFLQKADIFVFPSLEECFPLVLLEAMQHGLPVITTAEGGIPDIVVDGETGLLIKKNDVNDLAAKLALLIDDQERRKQMGAKGRERFDTNFTMEVWEKRLVEILRKEVNPQPGTTQFFFDLLAISMGRQREFPALGMETWEELFEQAKKQSLLGVMMAGLDALPRRGGAPLRYYSRWALMTEDIEKKSAARLEAARALHRQFAAAGLRSCVLKGPSVAAYYPIPERRQCGDIDIWVEGGVKTVMTYLRETCPTRNIVYHHCDAKLIDNISVEVHFKPSWMNSFILNKRFQRYCEDEKESQFTHYDANLGFAVPTSDFAAVFSIVHIWRHVMDEGVGLRQLMDLHYLLESLDDGQRAKAASHLRRLGLGRFSAAVMYTLREVFGLAEERLLMPPAQRDGAFLLDEILLAGNFGHYDTRIKRSENESRVEKTVRKFRRDMRFFAFCPRDVMASPFFKLWQYCWRRKNGYLE